MPLRIPKRQKRIASAPTRAPDARSSEEVMAEAKRQHAENERICRASLKQRAEREAEMAKKKAQDEKRKLRAAAEVLLCNEQMTTPSTAPSSEPLRPTTARKRSAYEMSPHTGCRLRPRARLVWRDASCPPEVSTFGETAAAEGLRSLTHADLPKRELFEAAARDGLVVVASGSSYATDGLASRWHSTAPWSEMASCLKVEENADYKARLISDGGLGFTLAGSGTFNVVLAPSASTPRAPYLSGEDVVFRFTRPDTGSSQQHKYDELDAVAGEAANAFMAAKAGFGVRVHSVAIFRGLRPDHALHYGAVYAMERADCDLYRFLQKARSYDQVARAACSACDLLYEASRSGVLFADIKPNNLLVMPDGRMRLADFDAAFFLVTREDWRSLLLANLALLSAHVRNTNFPFIRAWAEAVAPLLRQLIERRAAYSCHWLFVARSVRVSFDRPSGNDSFEVERLFTSLACSYFYKEGLEDCPAARFPWERKDQAGLDIFWHVAGNRSRWPKMWPAQYTPLVQQLVTFALSEL